MVLSNENRDLQKHHRRSIRLKGYDYSQPGAYFVTICSHNRESIFGEIVDGEMVLNRYGRIVLTGWQNLSKRHALIELDAFVVMPNHIHGIVMIRDAPSGGNLDPISGIAKRDSFPEIVRGFKTFSARRINRARGVVGISVWQRNYWEHVIRNQEALNRVREYILALFRSPTFASGDSVTLYP